MAMMIQPDLSNRAPTATLLRQMKEEETRSMAISETITSLTRDKEELIKENRSLKVTSIILGILVVGFSIGWLLEAINSIQCV